MNDEEEVLEEDKELEEVEDLPEGMIPDLGDDDDTDPENRFH
jgi:hypothetical protein